MEEILEKIRITLNLLGYQIQEKDDSKLEFLINEQLSEIMYMCGIDEISKPLMYVISDKVCAIFLKNKIALGQNIGTTIGTNAKDIKIGDISVRFPDNSSVEEKINIILDKLERKDFDYAPYSKMRW